MSARRFSHEERAAFKEMAERVATQLFAELKAQTITKIGIDEIRSKLRLETGCPRDAASFDRLEEIATRCVVGKC